MTGTAFAIDLPLSGPVTLLKREAERWGAHMAKQAHDMMGLAERSGNLTEEIFDGTIMPAIMKDWNDIIAQVAPHINERRLAKFKSAAWRAFRARLKKIETEQRLCPTS